jgi:hypothetical protein
MAFSFIIHQAEWRTKVVFMGINTAGHLHFIAGQFMWRITAVIESFIGQNQFLNWSLDKCPMSGTISKLGFYF